MKAILLPRKDATNRCFAAEELRRMKEYLEKEIKGLCHTVRIMRGLSRGEVVVVGGIKAPRGCAEECGGSG